MADGYSNAQKQLMLASFALGQAQRELEEAEEKFQAALRECEKWEGLALPTANDVLGILGACEQKGAGK